MKKIGKEDMTLLIFSILLGFLVCTQMKQKLDMYVPISLNSIEVAENQINYTSEEIDSLKALINKKSEELRKIEASQVNGKDIKDVLNEEVDNTKMASGLMDLEGPGIVITLKDNQSEEIVGSSIDDDLVHDYDVLTIVNDLRAAGAEAISVNGQRIINITEVKCGGPIVRINGKSVGTPFEIKAIGDPKVLNASINAPGTYGYILKNYYKIFIETSIEDEVFIPSYNREPKFQFANPIKEGE